MKTTDVLKKLREQIEETEEIIWKRQDEMDEHQVEALSSMNHSISLIEDVLFRLAIDIGKTKASSKGASS